MYKDVTNPHQQALDEIEKIENMSRPNNWRAARDFYLKLHPEFKPYEKDFTEACKELREASNITASSKSGNMRNTMKFPPYVYKAMTMLDMNFLEDTSGKNGKALETISKQLWRAFPEYRIARQY